MGIIKQLPKDVSNLIAAGEVVEHVFHVVKELIENSIDAGSSKIDVYLENSGLSLIRISDNGSGMSKEDLLLCVERHATSKIQHASDLNHIKSLGFRGEALASLAAVAEIKIHSSTGKDGHQLNVVHQQKTLKPSAHNQGTRVTVKQLFYQTPARLKFIKNPQQELSKTLKMIHQEALSHPHIQFSLTHEKTKLFATAGDQNILKIIYSIYGADVTQSLFEIKIKDRDYQGFGYFAKPMYHRSNSDSIYLFVNDRAVRNKALIKTIKDAYKMYMPVSKYPIGFLYLKTDPLLIDVNTHPQKKTVKLSEEKRLKTLILETLLNALSNTQVLARHPMKSSDTTFESLRLEELHTDYESNAKPLPSKKPARSFPVMEYVGQVHGTYLVMQSDESMFLIDQHAAAERIRYEKYLAAMQTFNGSVQLLSTPLKISLSSVETMELLPHISIFESFGLKVKLKDHTLEVFEIPHYFHPGKEEEYTQIMIESLLENHAVEKRDLVDQMAKDLSCKHSIKGNEYLSKTTALYLINDLKTCHNPFHCPHGRPTIIEYTQKSLENMFGRILS